MFIKTLSSKQLYILGIKNIDQANKELSSVKIPSKADVEEAIVPVKQVLSAPTSSVTPGNEQVGDNNAYDQGRNAQVRRDRLADRRRLRGAFFFPSLLFVYRKTVNILHNLAFR